MKKNYIFGIAAALMMGTVALSSCSSEELTVKNEVQQAEVAKTYSFSVPASMDDEAGTRVFELGESTITSAFSTAEPVYVIIEKKMVVTSRMVVTRMIILKWLCIRRMCLLMEHLAQS